ncbi:MAG TPA: deoxyribodipyrimidine photo-lyase, partial [bacterium]|nr:deoxyribodipyrimidine photo-lyase [bacterium]
MSPRSTLVWFRNDLRLADHPALWEAVERGAPVIPVFILPSPEENSGSPGGAGRWWLHHSLLSLDADLRRAGSRLIVRAGDPLSVLRRLTEECHVEAIYWNRRYEPAAVARDAEVKAEFRARGLTIESFNGSLLYEPWQVLNKEEKPYRVFTPFWKACLALREPGTPLPEPVRIPAPATWPESL